MSVLHVAIYIVSHYSAVHKVHVMGCRNYAYCSRCTLCENEVCLYTYKLMYVRTYVHTYMCVCSWSATGLVHSDLLTRDSCGLIFILLCGVSQCVHTL